MKAFALPAGVEAASPPTARDGVRLLVAAPDGLTHARFTEFAQYLEPGDLVVVNTSATLAAAVDGVRSDGRPVTVHFATALDGGDWVVEIRPQGEASGPVTDGGVGDRVVLPDGVELSVVAAHPTGQHRLWRASVAVEGGVVAYLARHGRPIRYAYVPTPVPLGEYQTVFAREAGSAEMPSAGRPFTAELVVDLVTRGVGVAPITLHTGVSSPERHEPPYPERFVVPAATARLVNHVHADGGRVIAVGTTVVRALESAAAPGGAVTPADGWTGLVVTAERGLFAVDGLITGWHEPQASHLQLLEAVAGADLLRRSYDAALAAGYLWHEFGDSHLIV